jgi:hypothetical protein
MIEKILNKIIYEQKFSVLNMLLACTILYDLALKQYNAMFFMIILYIISIILVNKKNKGELKK